MTSDKATFRRWREHDRVADGALAVALTALAFVPTLSTIAPQIGDLTPVRSVDALGTALVAAQALPLVLRRRSPAVCLALIGIAFAAHQALAYPQTFAGLGLYLALYAAGAHQARHRARLGAAATAVYIALAFVLHALGSPQRVPDFLAFYLALVVIWAAGVGMRRWRAEEVERRRLAAEVAAADERVRIARELHDVVTHHVTAVVVQADAAQFLLTAAPDRAAVSLEAISDTGRQALTELRSLLGVLEATGTPAAEAGREPAPGRIGDLVERARTSGQPVSWTEEGEPKTLAAEAQLAAYRVVQESLTNAMKHAPGRPTEVRLRHGDDAIEIVVTTGGSDDSLRMPLQAPAPAPGNAPRQLPSSDTAPRRPLPTSGRGLQGLRERLRTLDGELTAGPDSGGGFEVRAVIPCRSITAATGKRS